MKNTRFKFFVMICLIVVGVTACSGGETTEEEDCTFDFSDAVQNYDVIPDLLNATCARLSECFGGVSESECYDSLNMDTELEEALVGNLGGTGGTPIDELPVYNDIPSFGCVHLYNEENFVACLSEISATSCTTIEQGNYFSAENSTDYSFVYQMMPADCSAVVETLCWDPPQQCL